MDKSRGGRPKLTREEKDSGLANTKELAKEVRGASGLSVAQLLTKMNNYGVMSTAESLWRKYEAGIAAMSPDRLHNIAIFAWAHGWAGKSAWQILSQAGHAKHAERWIAEEKRIRVLQEGMQSIFEELLPGKLDDEAIQMLDILILKARNAAIDRARLVVEGRRDELIDLMVAAEVTELEDSIFIPAKPRAKGGFGNSIRMPKWLKGKKIDH